MGNLVVGCFKILEMKNGDCSNVKLMVYVFFVVCKLSFLGVKCRFVGSVKNVLFGMVLNVLIVVVFLVIFSNYFRIGNVSYFK